MQKELNPDLFPTGSNTSNQGNHKNKVSSSDFSAENREPLRQRLENKIQIQETDEKFAEVRLQIKLMQEKLASVVGQVNEFIKSSQAKTDRQQAHLKSIDTQHQAHTQDLQAKLTHVHHRLNERKNMEQKIQELIDRHNAVLRSYEVRMTHMQRLISEKESQYLQSQAQLNELKMEISRLKRI
jgi:chromosome segregation ATPase